ncbi:MAG TPA: serine/threonine-protein kinase [Pyrinomonadaceae bacterium]|nr:serine/threonine-protein kinase [Pyrinomonadaceae bacterium]
MSSTFLLNSMVGEYRLIDFLGAGGMGEVYRGMHDKIGRVAAIKVLTVAARSDPGFVQRFFNEARIQASLQHPNIATLYDFLECQGQPCIVMEYIDGQTLCDRVRPYGPMHPTEALQIFAAVVDAITYIHANGIIHRDIKSNNIKIGSGGQVKLLDFGIAKGNMSPGLTETGSVVGTLEYISPEQLATGASDPRSDIWALGVLLYEMMTGRVPFEAQTLGALCDKISRVDFPAPKQLNPTVPSDVASIISRCLKKNPSERYQSAAALLSDVRRAQAALAAGPSKPISKPNPKMPSAMHTTWPQHTTDSQPGSNNWLKFSGIGLLTIVFLILAAVGVYYVMNGVGETQADTPPTAGSADKMKTVKVAMMDGPAEIWQGDKMLGNKEVKVTAPIGQRVTLKLKRGDQVRTVWFDMTQNSPDYHYTMK